MIRIEVGPDPIDVAGALAAIKVAGAGAVASFIGIVRGDRGLITLRLEYYPGMTQAALTMLAHAAMARWPLGAVTLLHRTGEMAVGDHIVLVATAAAHRSAALEGCAFLIDGLKTRAPFWKRECFADGRCAWVDARDSDDAAAARWG